MHVGISPQLEVFYLLQSTLRLTYDHLSLFLLLKKSNNWEIIRAKYILDDYHGYCDGNFSDDERRIPSILILDMLKDLDKMREALQKKVEVSISMIY